MKCFVNCEIHIQTWLIVIGQRKNCSVEKSYQEHLTKNPSSQRIIKSWKLAPLGRWQRVSGGKGGLTFYWGQSQICFIKTFIAHPQKLQPITLIMYLVGGHILLDNYFFSPSIWAFIGFIKVINGSSWTHKIEIGRQFKVKISQQTNHYQQDHLLTLMYSEKC